MFTLDFKVKMTAYYIRFWLIALVIPTGLFHFALGIEGSILDKIESVWQGAFQIAREILEG